MSRKLKVTDHVAVYRGEEGRERKVAEGPIVKIDGEVVTIRKIGTHYNFNAFLGEDTINVIL